MLAVVLSVITAVPESNAAGELLLLLVKNKEFFKILSILIVRHPQHQSGRPAKPYMS